MRAPPRCSLLSRVRTSCQRVRTSRACGPPSLAKSCPYEVERLPPPFLFFLILALPASMTTPRRRSVAHEELDSRVHAVATAFVNAGLHALDMLDPGTTLSREQLATREREWVVSMLGRSGSDAVDGDVPASWWRMWPRDRQMACLEELDQERWFYAGWALVDEPSPLTLRIVSPVS